MAVSGSEKDIMILMIEDDLTLCELVGSFLEKKGYDFAHHNSYEGAIECARRVKPDLIIMDLHFPDGNGLHLCKLMKDDKDLTGIPILVLTTRDYPVEKEIALSSGVTDFFHKPMDYGLFADKIDEILGDSIEIIFWGVRGSTPCPGEEYTKYGGNSTCLQILIPGQKKLLILDAGSGIRALGNELLASGKPLNGRIFFTHAHWDHIQGFPFFKPLYVPDSRFDIHMPPQMEGNTKEVLLDQMSYTYFPVTSQMLQAKLEYHVQSHAQQQYEGYSIQYMSANHPVETAIYKITIGKKTIVFCPDNELSMANVDSNGEGDPFLRQFDEFVKDADVLIHDAQYDREEYEKKRNWGHSAWEVVVETAKKNNIRHVFLTHFDPDSTDEKLDQISEKLKEMVKDLGIHAELAKEGSHFKVPA
ncbi:response regulator [Balneolaceae bacterium ANBcel3]|nr:response regulator [Balneolaceae bacterium ANBcel3]